MIATIHIGHVLREAVASSYRNLVTRPTGVAVRDRIEATLDDAGCVCACLDFSDVDLLDFSCADEIVAKLLMARRGTRFVMLRGLREDHHEAVEHVLTHHRLAAAAILPGSDEPQLLGWATPDSHAAFDALCACGSLTAAELAERLDWDETRAHQALCFLALHRVIRDEDEVYSPLPAV